MTKHTSDSTLKKKNSFTTNTKYINNTIQLVKITLLTLWNTVNDHEDTSDKLRENASFILYLFISKIKMSRCKENCRQFSCWCSSTSKSTCSYFLSYSSESRSLPHLYQQYFSWCGYSPQDKLGQHSCWLSQVKYCSNLSTSSRLIFFAVSSCCSRHLSWKVLVLMLCKYF